MAENLFLTDSGMPILLLPTYTQYQRELEEKTNPERVEEWVEENLKAIKLKDSCYERFIRKTAEFYPKQDSHNKVALERLTAGYVLLDRESPLPKLDEKKFEEAFRVLSPRELAIFNIGAHLDMIEYENPVFNKFIVDSSDYMPENSSNNPFESLQNPSLRTCLMSDLSNGYVILATCKSR
jgi:hypothetical protein